MSLQALREEVLDANLELVRRGLVVFTFGNASGCDRASGKVVIKPSGVPYELLTPESLVVTDLDGKILEGSLRPSSDLPTHLALYRAFSGVQGVVHTHSRYATAWAQAGDHRRRRHAVRDFRCSTRSPGIAAAASGFVSAQRPADRVGEPSSARPAALLTRMMGQAMNRPLTNVLFGAFGGGGGGPAGPGAGETGAASARSAQPTRRAPGLRQSRRDRPGLRACRGAGPARRTRIADLLEARKYRRPLRDPPVAGRCRAT